jgi:hypothetical protein
VIPRSAAVRAAWAAFALALPAYLATVNRTLGFVDRGELAAAAATFGIAHPTGYPTLMLLGGALVHLVPLRPILTLNLLAAVLTAAGVGVLTLVLDRVLAAAGGGLGAGRRAGYALLSALFAAFTITWWQQANGFEVYSLHALLMSLIVLLFLRWLERTEADGAGPPSRAAERAGWALAFVVGVSFTNHLTTALLGPGLVAAAAMRLGVVRLARFVPRLVPAFVPPLAAYLWLPLRSATQPRFDWGDPETPAALLRHVTGAQYHGMAFDPERMGLQVRYLLFRVPGDFAWAGLVVAALGAVVLLRRAPALAAAALAFVAAGAAFASVYGVPDPDAYLLTGLLGAGACFAAGLLRLHERFGARAAIGVAAALVVANAALHARECDESRHTLAESLARDALGPLPENAVLFTGMWEVLDAPGRYLQEVEGYRRDVLVVNPNQMLTPWYLSELSHRAPEAARRAGPEFERHAATYRAGRRGERTAEDVDRTRAAAVAAFARACLVDRPVFTTGALAEVGPDLHRVPWHLALWLRADTAYVPQPAWRPAYRPWRGRVDVYAAMASQSYAEARVERARYEAAHGRPAAARELLRDLSAFDPGIRPERVPPMPLGFDAGVLATARFFRELEAGDPLAAAP